MPNSSPLGKEVIKDWFSKRTDITTILDIGPGMGTYYDLLGPNYYWIGVEVWKPYVEKYDLWKKYDKIYIEDYSKMPYIIDADCLILGDVLEHFDKETALNLFKKASKHCPHIVLSIPLGKYDQGELAGNPYETHLSTWTLEEVEKLTDWEIKETFIVNPQLPELKIGVFIK